MGRIRTVKPQHWNDRELPLISLHAHLLWISTWNFSDDKGIFENDPILIKSQSFPRRQDINPDMITQWLNELKDQNFIIPFTYKSVDYFITRTFNSHQKIDKPQRSKIPDTEIRRILGEDSPNDSGQISPVLYSNSSVKESTVMAGTAAKSENIPIKNDLKEAAQDAPPPHANTKTKRSAFIPPTFDEVKKYFVFKAGDSKQSGAWMPNICHVEAYAMFNHYEANGWKQGRGKQIVSWQAAANNWILNCKRGTFTAATQEKHTNTINPNTPADSQPGPQIRKLSPAQTSINYLFERYIEAPENCTIISIEATYYNDIVKANLYDPSPDDKEIFKVQAISYLTNAGKTISEENKTNIAKKFAVLEFFKILNAQGKAIVF